MKSVELRSVLRSLESGARPPGGASESTGEIASLGGEHLNGDGGFLLTNVKRIPRAFFDKMRAGRITPRDILVVKDGATTGKTSMVRDNFPFDEAAVNEHVFRLEVDSFKAVPEYVFHFLRSPRGQKAIHLDYRGATIGGISRDFATKVLLPLPPLPEQRRIADILDRADALRAQRRAAVALLDDLAQSVFLDMFGDPVSNRRGWVLKSLGESLTFQLYGPMFYNEKYSDDGVPIVRITDLDSQGKLDFASMPRLVVGEEDRKKYRLLPGDILFARTGATVGKVALIQHDDPECIAGAYFIVMRFSSELNPQFVRSVLTSKSMQQIVWIRSQQSAQQNFSGPGLRSLPMPHPPIDLQNQFADRIAAIESVYEQHRRALTQLDALFASLQHRAFRGEL